MVYGFHEGFQKGQTECQHYCTFESGIVDKNILAHISYLLVAYLLLAVNCGVREQRKIFAQGIAKEKVGRLLVLKGVFC